MIGEKFAFTIKLFMNTANESQKENNYSPPALQSKGLRKHHSQYNTILYLPKLHLGVIKTR